MKRPLPCRDLELDDPEMVRMKDLGLRTCQPLYEKATGKFKCPNKGGDNGCEGGAFLYPRKPSKGYFHFHQGIDLGQLEPGVKEMLQKSGAEGFPILSVTDGIVVHTQEWDGVSSGYGTSVGIYHRDSERLFWYAHCLAKSITVSEGQPVSEGQVIALVGNTGKAGAHHLHFEVIKSKFKNNRPEYKQPIGGKEWERELGDARGPRLDPLKVLAEPGPWGPKQVFTPWGTAFDPKWAADLHDAVEVQSYGGYFPLGANNFWHGGVHLPLLEGTLVHAACDGTIVAAARAASRRSRTSAPTRASTCCSAPART